MTEKIKPDKRARWKQELAIRHAQARKKVNEQRVQGGGPLSQELEEDDRWGKRGFVDPE